MTVDLNALNKKAYERSRVLGAYDRATDLFAVERQILADLGARLPLPDGPVLDLGIGAGRTSGALSALSRPYLGIDYVPEMVALAKARHPGLDLQVMNARRMTAIAPASQALIWFSFNGIDSIGPDGRKEVFAEVARMLMPNGLFVFSSHNLAFDGLDVRLRPGLPQLTMTDPVGSARRLAGYMRALGASRRMRGHERRGDDFAVLNDDAHGHALLQCYIRPSHQGAQLAEAGLHLIEARDLDGRRLDAGDDAPACDQIHYIATRA